jgi:hypothetical protein
MIILKFKGCFYHEKRWEIFGKKLKEIGVKKGCDGSTSSLKRK